MGQTVAGILTASAILGALFIIGKFVARFLEVFRKFAHFVDDLTGEPPRPGFPDGRPGLLQRLDSVERHLAVVPELAERLAAVEAQLKPNGGNSLRDVVDRMAPPVSSPEQQNPAAA